MNALLAIDVGGSTSRATLVDMEGRCLGQGRNRGGNPGSNPPEQAAAAIIAAAQAAAAEAGGPLDIKVALLAIAGPRNAEMQRRLEEAFKAMGLSGPLVLDGDTNAMLPSVTAALEGRGPKTALTKAVLESLGIAVTADKSFSGRPEALRLFIDAIYKMRPIELARFAPQVIANPDDPVAAALLAQAERYLLEDFRLVFDPTMPGPVVLGGSVAAHLSGLPAALADLLRAAGHEPDIRIAGDPSVGAAVLALRHQGVVVDEAMLSRIAASMASRAKAPVPA